MVINTGNEPAENENLNVLSYVGTTEPEELATLLSGIMSREEIWSMLADGLTVGETEAVFAERMTSEETAAQLAARTFPGLPGLQLYEETEAGVTFASSELSTFGIVYTVDPYWYTDGNTYDYTLAGGDSISLTALMESVGAAEYARDEDIVSVVSSDTGLVWAGQALTDTTIGELKNANSLDMQYSSDMLQQIEDINARTVSAGEWIIISVQPFAGEETLTVTLVNGAVFTVRMNDGQIREEVKTASGGTFEISMTYGEEACIPDTAVLTAGEL